MSFEIEKKFLVMDFNTTLKQLSNDFGKYVQEKKYGFCFADNYSDNDIMIDLPISSISRKHVEIIKEIGEFEIPLENFQFARLRIINNKKFLLTFKQKNLINNIEHNVEYEFDVERGTFITISDYLLEKTNIFYYNIKDTYKFKHEKISIELSKFNNIMDQYMEIEITGDDEQELTNELEEFLKKFKDYSLKEESRSYTELSRIENFNKLKTQRLNYYSNDAKKELLNLLKV